MYEPTEFGGHVYWRESQRPARLGPLDYRAIVFILPILLYFRFITVVIAIIALVAFWYLEKKKVQPDNVLRWIRATLAGNIRTSHGPTRQRKPVDFGFEDDEHLERMRLKIERRVSMAAGGKKVAGGKKARAAKTTKKDGKTSPKLDGAKA